MSAAECLSLGRHGCALVVSLELFSSSGGPFVQDIVSDLLHQTYQPILQFILRWLHQGVLDDPFHEFFIQDQGPDIAADRLWQDKYVLRQEMLLPSQRLPSDAVEHLLTIGKFVG